MRGFSSILIISIVLIVIALGASAYWLNNKNTSSPDNPRPSYLEDISPNENPFSLRYSRGKCQGEGTVAFTHPPMKIEDIGQVEPYGLMTDAHVIPTSHGYVYPIDFNSQRDAYPVYAVSDGTIVYVSHRGQFVGDKQTDSKVDEYQMYLEHSCSFYSYYDLLTSLAPEIEKEVGKLTGFEQKYVRIPVKAGQLVGRVGAQTIDFAVWNFDKEPSFFVNPSSYAEDEDRFYLDDMFAYFEEPLKTQLLAKNNRTAEPRTGKVAYDIEGRLVGNWFREGSGGFRGSKDIHKIPGGRYWDGHLSIVYDHIDPTQIRFSIGNYQGKAVQFGIVGNSPDPKDVGVDTGMIKYELQFAQRGGASFGSVQGTVLLQLIEPNKLKLEIFPGKTQEQVPEFTNKALIYDR